MLKNYESESTATGIVSSASDSNNIVGVLQAADRGQDLSADLVCWPGARSQARALAAAVAVAGAWKGHHSGSSSSRNTGKERQKLLVPQLQQGASQIRNTTSSGLLKQYFGHNILPLSNCVRAAP